MEFKVRYKNLMDERGLTFEDVAAYLKKQPQTVADWAKGRHMPKMSDVFGLSNLFKCSIDYLLGRTEDNKELKPKKIPSFSDQLAKRFKENNTSRYKLGKYNALTRGAEFKIFCRKSDPKVHTIEKIANFMGVSIDYLVGRI